MRSRRMAARGGRVPCEQVGKARARIPETGDGCERINSATFSTCRFHLGSSGTYRARAHAAASRAGSPGFAVRDRPQPGHDFRLVRLQDLAQSGQLVWRCGDQTVGKVIDLEGVVGEHCHARVEMLSTGRIRFLEQLLQWGIGPAPVTGELLDDRRDVGGTSNSQRARPCPMPRAFPGLRPVPTRPPRSGRGPPGRPAHSSVRPASSCCAENRSSLACGSTAGDSAHSQSEGKKRVFGPGVPELRAFFQQELGAGLAGFSRCLRVSQSRSERTR